MRVGRVIKMAGGVIALMLSACTGPDHVTRDLTRYVNPFMGSSRAGKGLLRPIASVPFGMVQLGPDTRCAGPGYVWKD